MLRDSPVMHVWAGDVLLSLGRGTRSFNALLAGIEGISDRMLSCRLRELDDAGLVKRRVIIGPPVRVYYDLTGAGLDYVAPLRQLDNLAAPAPQEAAVG